MSERTVGAAPRRPAPGAGSLPRRVCLAAGLAMCLLNGCRTPRPYLDAGRAVSRAVGLVEPVGFRVVGPDGSPIDEPDHAGAELSLTDAVRRAVTTDPGLQAALARVRIAAADADQARLLPNPVLGVVLRWGPGFDGKPQIEASLAQDLVGLLSMPRRSSAADNRLRAAAQDAVTTALDLVFEVQERYSGAQAADRMIEATGERLGLLDRLAGVAQARLEAGEGVRADVTTLRAQQVGLEVEAAEARRLRQENRLRLARLIGEPSGTTEWTLDPWSLPTEEPATEARWVRVALWHRPEIRALRWRLAALGDDAALAGLLPWDGAEAGVAAERDDEWTVGPAVSTPLPVFDTGRIAQARADAAVLEARHTLTQVRRGVVEDVRVAYQSLASHLENLDRVQSELMPLAEQRRREAEAAYRAGLTDITALFLAEQDLQTARAKAIEVELEAALALAGLQRAVGGSGVARTHAGPTPQPPPEAEISPDPKPSTEISTEAGRPARLEPS